MTEYIEKQREVPNITGHHVVPFHESDMRSCNGRLRMCGSDEGMLNVACGGKAADGNRDRGSSIGKPRETRLSVFPLSLRLPVSSPSIPKQSLNTNRLGRRIIRTRLFRRIRNPRSDVRCYPGDDSIYLW